MTGNTGYRITLPRLLRTWYLNAVNGLVLLFSWGRRVDHEGKYRCGRWSDWAREFSSRPASYETPRTEAELCDIVRNARKVRVVGAGHSFNAAPLTDHTMISLDALHDVELLDHPDRPDRRIARVQTGIRLRDLNRRLSDAGLALSVAGSTDPQSIGGLIATDLHGTGRDHGFLSEVLRSLRIVDADGNVADHRPGDDVFHAAIGGIGTCGVVVGADIEVEPAYNLVTAVRIMDRVDAEDRIEELLEEHTHLSFYYFGGFARRGVQEDERGLSVVRRNTWDRTTRTPSRFLRTRKLIAELADLLFSGFLFDAARLLHIANPVARIGLGIYGAIVQRKELVAPSPDGFARTLYFRHDEIEYGVPFENYRECLDDVRRLLLDHKYPTIVEIRFTPDRSQALLGPGVGRRTAYIELATSMSKPTDPIFEEFEEILLDHGGRAHLGKKTYIGPDELAEMYPADVLARFAAARARQDPHGKFTNDYTTHLFGQPAELETTG